MDPDVKGRSVNFDVKGNVADSGVKGNPPLISEQRKKHQMGSANLQIDIGKGQCDLDVYG